MTEADPIPRRARPTREWIRVQVDEFTLAGYDPEIYDRIEAALRSAVQEAQAWQPIETAPKDGSVLLLGEFQLDGPRAYVGRYGLKVGRVLGWHTIPGCFARNPTHWQPLPPVPEAAE